ncbi:collectrin [Rhinophrynus dorsalis]
MLGRLLTVTLSLVSFVYADLCKPGAPGAFKVRLSIKTALGEKAYTWTADEEYLFKAMMTFSMRTYTKDSRFQMSNILLCNVTRRVSFWFVVTSPSNEIDPFSSSAVEAAIRQERSRINDAFLLNDKTLEFIAIPPTMAPNPESMRSSWLIVFGVIVGVITFALVYLVASGIVQRRKRESSAEEPGQDEYKEESGENEAGVVYEHVRCSTGLVNSSYDDSEEALTPL